MHLLLRDHDWLLLLSVVNCAHGAVEDSLVDISLTGFSGFPDYLRGGAWHMNTSLFGVVKNRFINVGDVLIHFGFGFVFLFFIVSFGPVIFSYLI